MGLFGQPVKSDFFRKLFILLSSLPAGIRPEGSRLRTAASFLRILFASKVYGKAGRGINLSHYKVVLRDTKSAGTLLPWVHRVISNPKAVIRGAHRGVSEKHLQSYLSEICYRFNRRFWERELFDRLIKACVSTGSITYSQLIKKKISL
jgi:hypothetical protein